MTLGYQQVSIDQVSREAGVSKETIYRYFSDKPQLFRAAMRAASSDFAINFPKLLSADDEIEQVLIRSAHAIRDRNLDDQSPKPSWLAMGIANSFSDLSAIVFNDYFESIAPLGEYLRSLSSRHMEDEVHAAYLLPQFCSLSVGGLSYLMASSVPNDAKFGIPPMVHLFLNGCLIADAPSPSLRTGEVHTLPAAQPLHRYPPHIDHLMQVAREQFYAHGYLGASLDEIGSTAKFGRGTLYRHFGSKEGLFRTVMLQSGAALMQDAQLTIDPAQSLDDNLHAAALTIANIMQASPMISLYRTVSDQMKAMPDLAQAVHDQSYLALQRPLAAYLTSCIKSGQLDLTDGDWAAYQFATLALGGNHYLITNPAPTPATRAANAHRAVSTFLHGSIAR